MHFLAWFTFTRGISSCNFNINQKMQHTVMFSSCYFNINQEIARHTFWFLKLNSENFNCNWKINHLTKFSDTHILKLSMHNLAWFTFTRGLSSCIFNINQEKQHMVLLSSCNFSINQEIARRTFQFLMLTSEIFNWNWNINHSTSFSATLILKFSMHILAWFTFTRGLGSCNFNINQEMQHTVLLSSCNFNIN